MESCSSWLVAKHRCWYITHVCQSEPSSVTSVPWCGQAIAFLLSGMWVAFTSPQDTVLLRVLTVLGMCTLR